MKNNLRFWRNARNFRQSDLADKSECTQNTISAIENGTWLPSLSLAARIASALEVPITRLFDFSDEFTVYKVVSFNECDICPRYECVHCKVQEIDL